jgi:uncharacterized protein (TIGR02145 family)
MNKIFYSFIAVLISASIWAQAPQKISYQAVIRRANNALVVEKQVGVKISILQGSESGSAVYAETHTTITNANGLASLSIGAGTIVTGDFSKIDWSKGSYFVKTETDVEGGANYQVTSVSELMSVPFALYAANSQPGPKGDTGAQGPAGKDGKNGLEGKDGLLGPKGDTGAQGPQGLKGDTGLTGAQGPKGDIGEQGPKGLKGDTGLTGAQGPKGDPGNGLTNGTSNGEMLYWNGTTWISVIAGSEGQSLTFCGGKPTWTAGGVCPGSVSSLDCATATNNGTLKATTAASGVASEISYTGGNGGPYTGQVLTSTGVTGLTATLQAGNFANGVGSLTYTITGTPSTSGTASFALNIGGKTCVLTRTVPQNPKSGYGPNISDNDGNTYKTVYIGTQQWMAENLKTEKYSDGTIIPNVTDNTQWSNLTSAAWEYYNNDAANNDKYGKLYNWYAVSPTTNGNKNICPTGWHVPTDTEWTVLTDYLGGVSVAGGKMKEVGTTSWISPNAEATNTSLFTGLPGGYRYNDGNYINVGSVGLWWSSTENDADNTWNRYVGLYSGDVGRTANPKKLGLSVRCLRD